MKNLLLFALFLVPSTLSAQDYYQFCFETPILCFSSTGASFGAILEIDTVSNPNNCWQIGVPQKTEFDSAYSPVRAILTDTINPYPTANTSSFDIVLEPTLYPSNTVFWTNFRLEFNYRVDCDSLLDYGTIELSTDSGATWMDLINDPTYAPYIEWQTDFTGDLPVLTGNNGAWKHSQADMNALAQFLNIPVGSTLIWRFSFTSDSIQTNRDGLMYDNITIEKTPPIGVEETASSKDKELLRIVDIMGRITEDKPNTLLIYMYSDGSSKKVYRVE